MSTSKTPKGKSKSVKKPKLEEDEGDFILSQVDPGKSLTKPKECIDVLEDIPKQTKKKKKERRKEAAAKDLKVNKYFGLTMYPQINEVYGPDYTGKDEANMYSSCLSGCGEITKTLCCLCATCRCGPVLEIKQGYIGLVTEFGRFTKKLGPGLHTYNSCTQEIVLVDVRLQTLRIPTQDLITKDNISLRIDCFVQFKIMIPELASFKVGDYKRFISFTTMGTMKTIIAEKTLTDILAHEDEIEDKIREIIDDQVDDYGIHVDALETLKIEISRSMVTAMATVALAEKEMEAKIINAKGNYESARIFREAADELSKNELSLQLHYFETLKEMAHEKATVTFMPGQLIDFFM